MNKRNRALTGFFALSISLMGFISTGLTAEMPAKIEASPKSAATTAPAALPPASSTATPSSTPTVAPSTLTGTVQTTASISPATTEALPAALSAADYLEIEAKPGEAKHKLQQYALVLRNKRAAHLQVMQLEVTNGVTEQEYTQIHQQKSQAKMRVAGGVLRGLTSVATSFVPYAGIGSMAAYQAIGAGTAVANNAANLMQSAPGSVDYAGHILQHASDIMINPNNQFQCLVVVPQSQQPSLKVIFKDLQTNQIYDIQK